MPDKNKFEAIYKCRLCKQTVYISMDNYNVESGDEVVKLIQEDLILEKGMHQCNTKDYGIITLVGVRKAY